MKNATNVPNLDATKFYFRELDTTTSVFDMFVQPSKDRPSVIRTVNFINLENTDYYTNGTRFGFYGAGRVYEDEAVELDNGKYLYCIVSGVVFNGTFSPEDQVRMKYYEVTKL